MQKARCRFRRGLLCIRGSGRRLFPTVRFLQSVFCRQHNMMETHIRSFFMKKLVFAMAALMASVSVPAAQWVDF
ncbi:MAG: hypothetical protein ACI4SY_04435, partial [Sutterella sp.]